MWSVTLLAFGGLVFAISQQPSPVSHRHPSDLLELLFWTGVLATVELLPVPVSKVLHLTLGFPILLAVAILYKPPIAALVALVGSFDSRELRREIEPIKSLFNRAQIALSVWAGSELFHRFASINSRLYVFAPSILGATAVHYVVNLVLVAFAMRLMYKIPLRTLLGQLRVGAPSEFLLNYAGLGLIGGVIAELHHAVGPGAVVAFVLPLVFARQMFFRTMALEEASKELKDREQVLRALSNRMAEERQDERMQIAAYLHDDLAQMLFRLTLQVEMAKKRLVAGDLESVLKDLDGITSTKELTSNAVRALIRDLHRSPIGRKGLAEAVQSFAADISKGSPTRITTDVVEVSLPPPIQLLIYQIAREAAMNALKHAGAGNIWISLRDGDDGVELQIRDDGKGFDTEAPAPEGHFGSVMMRERAQVAGGRFSIQSELGRGTIITAAFPRVWVEEAQLLETDGQARIESPAPPQSSPSDGARRGRRSLRRPWRVAQPTPERVGAGASNATPSEFPGKQDDSQVADSKSEDRRPIPA